MKKSGEEDQRAVVVSLMDRKTLSLNDVKKAADKAKRVQASKAVILYGEETKIPEDVMKAANKSNVRLTMMSHDDAVVSQKN